MQNEAFKMLVEQLLAHPEVRSVSVELDGETFVADHGEVVPRTSRQHEVAVLVSRGCTNTVLVGQHARQRRHEHIGAIDRSLRALE